MTKGDFKRVRELLRAKSFTVSESSYDQKAFGSWYVSVLGQPRLRILWDGKDGWVMVQRETAERFQGLPVWQDLWVGRERGTHSVDFTVSKLEEFSKTTHDD